MNDSGGAAASSSTVRIVRSCTGIMGNQALMMNASAKNPRPATRKTKLNRSNGHPLVYLDNAASSQVPAAVIDEIARYQREDHANVHRGVHTLSHRATEAYEGARDDVVRFINAKSRSEIVFTRGTTEAINLVAQSFARPLLNPGDRIVITHLEHHSNIVPWQLIAEQTGATVKAVPVDENGEFLMEEYLKLLR